MVRSLVQLGSGAIVVAVASATSVASAAPPSLAVLDVGPDALFIGHAMPNALLVGSFGGGIGQLGRSPHGLFVGVDTGWARWLARDADVARNTVAMSDAANNGWAYGVRAGYQWRSGLAVQLRFDDLGVDVSRDGGSLLVASGGLRYSLPFVIMPFADVLFGEMFGGVDAAPAAGVGLGLSVPVARHAALDLTVRDWIADLGGSVRHIPAAMVGVNLGFGG